MNTYQLSILLITYNHEKYIHRCIQSILGQIITGPVELIIADDGSIDQTREIIHSYSNADQRFHFKYLNHFPNLGITKNYQRGFAECSGNYVAVIEGDDYWCNPQKLLRQYDFLESNWQCDLCSVNYFIYDETRSKLTPRIDAGSGYRLISARDLIADNIVGNFSTCMYRKSALDMLPISLFDIKSYDWIINICIAKSSLIGFIEEPMSVYRVHGSGVWSSSSDVEKIRIQLESIPSYDKLTGHVFKSEFIELARRLEQVIIMLELKHACKGMTKPGALIVNLIYDLTPPVFISIIKKMIPPVIKRFILKISNGARL
jgi:glycosyltransferase involved in cell wall biosynthesis